MLPTNTFLQAIDATPLVAIDLIVGDEAGGYLLGQRTNRPAQHFWFVPGGRIRKNERLDDAFQRIVEMELGISGITRESAALLGVYEHLYEDNFSGTPGISTHYVVLGYRLPHPANLVSLPAEQHDAYCWMRSGDILANATVHPNTQAYFR
ncbi:GDP-mannose mannosyl hydrolase [Burkholderia theae]|uniref:GDP-mannose mannosyl hydrolase n=1 Tax=Burkholderia theae TaxID=3143496 RepID=UPI0039F46A10